MNAILHPLTTPDITLGSIVPGDPRRSVWKSVCAATIVLDVDVRDKAGALGVVASICERSHVLHAGPILRALMRREEAGSTGLGQGIAIPHARVEGIDQPVVMFVRLREPIEYDAPDGNLVSQLFVILVPAHGSCDEHLELLASVAEMLSDRALRTLLGNLSAASDVRGAFVRWVSDKVGMAGKGVTADTSGPAPLPTSTLRRTGAC